MLNIGFNSISLQMMPRSSYSDGNPGSWEGQTHFATLNTRLWRLVSKECLDKKTLKSLSWLNHINLNSCAIEARYPSWLQFLWIYYQLLRLCFGGSGYLDRMYPTGSPPNVRVHILSRVSCNRCNSQPCQNFSWVEIMVGWALGAKGGASTRRNVIRDSWLNHWSNPLHQCTTWSGRRGGGSFKLLKSMLVGIIMDHHISPSR